MKKIIHHLRNRSEKDRRHVLHVFVFCAGVILIMLWIYSLGRNLTSPDTKAEISRDLEPFSTLKDSIPSEW